MRLMFVLFLFLSACLPHRLPESAHITDRTRYVASSLFTLEWVNGEPEIVLLARPVRPTSTYRGFAEIRLESVEKDDWHYYQVPPYVAADFKQIRILGPDRRPVVLSQAAATRIELLQVRRIDDTDGEILYRILLEEDPFKIYRVP